MSYASEPQPSTLYVRDSGLTSAIGLLLRTLPYALVHFGILVATSVACIIWLVIAVGGAAWLGSHIAGVFGLVWFILWAVGAGWFWRTLLRYLLHLVECGHVAVLTELITRGEIGNGRESMFDYGKRIVTQKFGQVNVLFVMNALVRGTVNTFHSTLDWIGEMLPIPGLDQLASLATAILRAATQYMDKVIFSYNLACNAENPWDNARTGLVYYCQNAKPILKTSVGIVALEYVLTFLVWIVMMAPAAVITLLLPHSMREMGGLITVIIAALFAFAARAAFVKPLFLIMIMVRFYSLIEHQPVNADWIAYLEQLSDKFRDLGQRAQTFVGGEFAYPRPPAGGPAGPGAPPFS